MITLSEVLIEARSLIDTPEKWRRGGGYGPTGDCRCIMLAVGDAGRSLGAHGVLTTRAGVLFDSLLPSTIKRRENPPWWPGFYDIVDYNDDPNTTHADILALLDRAIEITQKEEAQ